MPWGRRRQLGLATALAATLALTAWMAQVEPDEGEAHVVVEASERLHLPTSRDGDGENAVRLDRLARKPTADPTNNAFENRSWTKAPPPMPAVEAPAAPPVPEGPPSFPFTYMGMLQEGDQGPITVFLRQGDQGYHARPGDVIEQAWRVDGISSTRMEMTYLPMKAKLAIVFAESAQ